VAAAMRDAARRRIALEWFGFRVVRALAASADGSHPLRCSGCVKKAGGKVTLTYMTLMAWLGLVGGVTALTYAAQQHL